METAKNAPGYDSPEFLCGRFSDEKGKAFYYFSKVEEILRKNLKSVIVKFMDFPKDYVRYVNGVWRYVYSLKFDCEISQQTAICTFSGGGRTISKEQIIDLILDS